MLHSLEQSSKVPEAYCLQFKIHSSAILEVLSEHCTKKVIETDIFWALLCDSKIYCHSNVQIHIRVPYLVGSFVHGKILSQFRTTQNECCTHI